MAISNLPNLLAAERNLARQLAEGMRRGTAGSITTSALPSRISLPSPVARPEMTVLETDLARRVREGIARGTAGVTSWKPVPRPLPAPTRGPSAEAVAVVRRDLEWKIRDGRLHGTAGPRVVVP